MATWGGLEEQLQRFCTKRQRTAGDRRWLRHWLPESPLFPRYVELRLVFFFCEFNPVWPARHGTLRLPHSGLNPTRFAFVSSGKLEASLFRTMAFAICENPEVEVTLSPQIFFGLRASVFLGSPWLDMIPRWNNSFREKRQKNSLRSCSPA